MCLKPTKQTPPKPPPTVPSKSPPKTPPSAWYNCGGIQGITEIGMGINVIATPLFFYANLPQSDFLWGYSFHQIFLFALLLNVSSALLHGMKTIFCIICVSLYLSSLLIAFALPSTPLLLLSSILLTMFKVAICMSVCLHRYAAHSAFKCSVPLQYILNLLGCAANQGGPIWWASQHRCHHKFCELERDPHSALRVGTERAFVFFLERRGIEEEFVPRHNDGYLLRVLDTWSFIVPMFEHGMAYAYFGEQGLFISYTSMWLCECITLWFNIANHPSNGKGDVCKASGVRGAPKEWYPMFLLLHMLHPLLGCFAGEIGHDDHHDHPMLAKRDEMDLGYWAFILPLEMMGLVWDVRTKRI